REQLKYILPIIEKSLFDASLELEDLDAIAVTYGPGLIGPLLIGVETAKTISYVFNKPLIAVNHLIGHIYANWLEQKEDIEFPALALIVSGGHTDLVLLKSYKRLEWLGGTRDDAAGEAFDKVGRTLGLAYPAGAKIEELAKKGNEKAFNLPKALLSKDDFDFSFSGLKAAAAREIKKIELNEQMIADFCASLQKAVIDVLVRKTLSAAEKYNAKSILLGGGVAANQKLRDELSLKIENLKLKTDFFIPKKSLCTDNGAMIAAAAFYHGEKTNWNSLTANPNLYFD